MPARPTEVRAVRALLEGPADDAEELAERVIEALDEARASRPGFIIVQAYEGRLAYAYGPYPTQLKAEQAISKGLVPIVLGEYGICKLWSEKHAEKAIAAADEPVQLTTRAKDRGRHPVPYAADDHRSRRRYQRMSKQQKLDEYDRRLV